MWVNFRNPQGGVDFQRLLTGGPNRPAFIEDRLRRNTSTT